MNENYQAFKLANALSAAVDGASNPNAEKNLRVIAGLLAYDPDQLREDIIALKEAAGDTL